MSLISKEELEELYWGEPGTELGAPTIAKMLGCTKPTVYNYMKKYEIPRRPPTADGTGECFTKDTRRQISELFIGRTDLQGENHPLFGKHHSQKTKRKIAKNRRSYKGKMNPFYGKKHSIEVREIISKIHKGKIGFIGEDNPAAKLDNKTVLEIYNRYKNSSITQKELAREYKVSLASIRRITQARHSLTKKFNKINKKNKLTKEIGKKIYEEYFNKNITQEKLAEKYKLSNWTIWHIVNCEHWTTRHLKNEKN